MKMNIQVNQGMQMTAVTSGNSILMDAKSPLGQGSGMTPKELLLAGIGGCTAMDVLAYLKKHKQSFKSFDLEVETEQTTGSYPAVFKETMVKFLVTGDLDPKLLIESVHLSQTKYCGVSAMLSKAFPIKYGVYLNSELISEGQADFK